MGVEPAGVALTQLLSDINLSLGRRGKGEASTLYVCSITALWLSRAVDEAA